MTTTVRDDPDGHRYEVLVDGRVAGFAAYTRTGGRVTFTHTEVDDAYAGKGLARVLVRHALDEAVDRGLAVVPLCPYVRKVVSGDRERYLPLVPESVRDRLGLA